MFNPRNLLMTAVIAVALLGCGSSARSTDEAQQPVDQVDADATDVEEAPNSEADDAAETEAVSSDETTEEPTLEPGEPLLAGVSLIESTTPTEVDALRPTFTWSDVPGADSYFLVVLDDSGAPYWSWIGADNEVPLGGVQGFSDQGLGPIIGMNYTWSVSAYDADGSLLAISDSLTISTTAS